MSQLLELQRRVAAAVMEPLTKGDRMRRRRRDGSLAETEVNALIKPNGRLTSFERLEIYNRQYWFRILSCFADDFPGLRAIAGARKFERLMRAYLADCPSISFTLRNLGSRLEEWLEAHPEFVSPSGQLALDMVRIEWAHVEAFDGASCPVLTPADIELAGDDVQLALQPYVQLLQLSHAVDDLLIEIHNREAVEDTSSNNARVQRKRIPVRQYARPEPEQIYLAVHRLENSVYYKRLDREEFQILKGVRAGSDLERVFEETFRDSPTPLEERTALLEKWFASWAALGWFCRSDSLV